MSGSERNLLLGLVVAALAVVGIVFFFLTSGPQPPEVPATPLPPRPVYEAPQPPGERDKPAAVERTRVEPPTAPEVERTAVRAGLVGCVTGFVKSPDGNPLEAARVEVTHRANPLLKMLRIDTGPAYRSTSDAEGKFTICEIPAGTDYTFIGRHKDWAPAELGGITVTDGGTVDLGEVVLRRGQAIRGRVTNMAGAPLQDATVELWTAITGNPFQRGPDSLPEKTESTDSSGVFEFRNLAANNYVVTAHKEGYASRTQFNVSLAFGKRDADEEQVELQLEEAVFLGGMVTDEDGGPVPKAMVRAVNLNANYACNGFTTTDPAGSFLFPDLAPGFYQVTATADGYGEAKETRVEAGTNDLVLRMPRQAVVEGYVIAEATGNPVRNYTIKLRRYDRGNAPQPTRIEETVSSAKGRFRLGDVSPGRYRVFVLARGFAPGESEDFTVAKGDALSGIEVRLRAGGSIRAVLHDVSGSAVSGARIKLLENSYEDNAFTQLFAALETYQLGFDRDAASNAEGRFHIDHIPPGSYQIRVTHPHFASLYEKNVDVVEGQPTDLGDLILHAGGTIQGIVYNTAGGALAGQVVMVRAEKGMQRQARTGKDGRFRVGQLPPGPYTVSLYPEMTQNPFEAVLKSQKTQVTVDVPADQTVEVTLYDTDV